MAIFTANSGEQRLPPAQEMMEQMANNYSVVVPVSGATVNIPAETTDVNLVPANSLLSLTVNFPPAPYDGQTLVISSTRSITALVLNPVTGTLATSVSTLALGGSIEYKYLADLNVWIRKR